MSGVDGQSATVESRQSSTYNEPDNRVEEKTVPTASLVLDIEHALVNDDPRKWSKGRKYAIVAVISSASVIAGLGANIYNPAISQIESQLHATSGQLSLTLSLFILIQGGFPFLWSAISEVQGRKLVYLVSIALCMVGCIVAATSKTIQVLIGMRCLQAAGSSAVMSIGAATLADIYEPHERGTMMGIYYCAPLLGPSLGPILGGALTQGFNWRATFWFLVIFTGLCFLSFLPFKDTFRKERSTTYQSVLKRVLEQAAKKAELSATESTAGGREKQQAVNEKRDSAATVGPADTDLERQDQQDDAIEVAVKEVKVSLKDVNPVVPIIHVLRRKNNLAILFGSGLLFAFNYSITYTASRTLANKYHYDALKIGVVLLAYGVGCLCGSILGGRWSDLVLARVKAKHGGKSFAEMRLESTKIFMLFFPPSIVAYGWVCEQHVNVAAICVMLFLSGFFQICIYSSTLAYIVDSNVGRSSSAVATNSFFRGLFAFIATEVAVPLQNSIGDGGLYSLWAGLMVVSELLILLVWWKGSKWREQAIAREARSSKT
ncbi:vacuolar DHA amino acid exporter [Sparassis latifolia]|uniref:Major facilitator superfamily (MFS) profile domain-containing protein n=1 Tax=Sparassis crispa TaxID=139825 RepID=A0A401GYE7_9APHY|nr:hypothetical protein SCP_1004690 [Sparassis crispa]GBE87222.1 hypothetical protein SCP_1004690 [Sparassis crispa]